MKKILIIVNALIILLSACSPSITATTTENVSTVTSVTSASVLGTETATIIAPAPTSASTPTPSLPVGLLTPVPFSDSKISAQNVKELQEVARYYGEIGYVVKATKDQKFLFILDPDGIQKYDYSSMELLFHMEVANNASDLQISNDGSWLLIDQNWLMDLKNDKDPKLYVLSEKIDLLNFYARIFSLSPDGSILFVDQYRCYDGCLNRLQIVKTETFEVLNISYGANAETVPTFSSDGKYFALAELYTEASGGGDQKVSGASVVIWTVNDGKLNKITSVNARYPFYDVNSLAFSEDDRLIAVGQEESISIFDVLSGESVVTIKDLCKFPARKIMFVPSLPLRLLEYSDCNSGIWTIFENTATFTASDVTDFSKIVFDESGKYKAIPYPHPLSELKAAYSYNYFTFLDNDFISFQSMSNATDYSCDLLLNKSSFTCQSQAGKFKNGQWQRKDVILATDGKYYRYIVGQDRVDIFPLDNPSQIYYSIPYNNYFFSLLALDPINKLVFYEIALSSSISRDVIQDMEVNKTIFEYEGESSLQPIVFSGDGRYAALCQFIGHSTGILKDRLIIIDLVEKSIVHKEDFTCNGTALALSNDGTHLAAEYLTGDPNTGQYLTRLITLPVLSPYDRKNVDIKSIGAIAYSSDDLLLAVACEDANICFLDPLDGREFYRLKAHSQISNLAFSEDGTMLATWSQWGLISIWAVPPFARNTDSALLVSPLSYVDTTFSWDFNDEGDLEGWGEKDWQYEGLDNLRVRNGSLAANVTGPSTRLNNDNESLHIDASTLSQIEVRMKVSKGTHGVIYFTLADRNWVEDRGKYFELIPDNEFHTYVIDMSDVDSWAGFIEQLRIDPVADGQGTQVDIDYIHVLHPNVSWNFDEAGDLQGWDSWGEIDPVDVQNGYFSATTIGADPQIYSSGGLDIDTTRFSHIEIRMRVSEGEFAQLFFRHENEDLSETKSRTFKIKPGTEFKTYVINMGSSSNWQGIVDQLRLDPTSDIVGATFDIDYIKLLP